MNNNCVLLQNAVFIYNQCVADQWSSLSQPELFHLGLSLERGRQGFRWCTGHLWWGIILLLSFVRWVALGVTGFMIIYGITTG